jgi:hypothetical protein
VKTAKRTVLPKEFLKSISNLVIGRLVVVTCDGIINLPTELINSLVILAITFTGVSTASLSYNNAAASPLLLITNSATLVSVYVLWHKNLNQPSPPEPPT